MPKARKRRKTRRRSAPRVQAPRSCSEELSLYLSAGADRALMLTLGEAVKQLWARARALGLNEGQSIRCNSAMRELFGCARLDMCDIPGALSAHMRGAGASASGAASSSAAPAPAPAPAGPMLTLSPALSTLLGASSARMTQSEALRLLGKYVSTRSLRDPLDRRRIICDTVRHRRPPRTRRLRARE